MIRKQSSRQILTQKDHHKDSNMRNVVLLSIGFGLCFFGTNAFMNFAVPILGDLGSICMAIVNYVNAFSNFLVPSVIAFFGSPQRALFWCGFSYLIYVGEFAYIIPVTAYFICALHGFLSAVVWASQGIILGNNSNDSDRGRKSGLFLAVYMLGSAIGNFVSGILVDKLQISGHVEKGWNGTVSILFLFLALIAVTSVIPYSLIRPSVPYLSSSETGLNSDETKKENPQEVVVVTEEKTTSHVDESVPSSTENAAESSDCLQNQTTEVKEKQSVFEEIKQVLLLAVHPRMILLLCFFFNDGYQQVFLTSQFTRQLEDLSSVGTLMGIFSIADVIFANIHGYLCDKFGHVSVLTFATAGELIGFVLAWLANKEQNWLIYATGIVFAIADGGFQTECLNLVNQFFIEERTRANSVFRMLQCFGFAIALTLTPLFISKDASHSSPEQFLWEIICAAVLGVGGYIGCLVFLHKSKSAKPECCCLL